MEQTNTKRTAVTIAVFVATFMAAIEGTIVSTAMLLLSAPCRASS